MDQVHLLLELGNSLVFMVNILNEDGTYTHFVDFLGTIIIDSVRSNDVIPSGTVASWNYDSILDSGNYNITTVNEKVSI